MSLKTSFQDCGSLVPGTSFEPDTRWWSPNRFGELLVEAESPNDELVIQLTRNLKTNLSG